MKFKTDDVVQIAESYLRQKVGFRKRKKNRTLNSIATELEIHRQGLNTQLAPTSRVIYNADTAPKVFGKYSLELAPTSD